LGGEKAQNLALKIVATPKIIYSIVPKFQIFGTVENEKLFPT
jgi:hypothetical protein